MYFFFFHFPRVRLSELAELVDSWHEIGASEEKNEERLRRAMLCATNTMLDENDKSFSQGLRRASLPLIFVLFCGVARFFFLSTDLDVLQ